MVRITWPSWVTLLAGLWLLVAPFSTGYVVLTTAGTIDDVVMAILIAGTSAWICTSDRLMLGQSFAMPFYGLWLLAAPFLFDFRHLFVALANDVAVGLIVCVAGVVQISIVVRESERV